MYALLVLSEITIFVAPIIALIASKWVVVGMNTHMLGEWNAL